MRKRIVMFITTLALSTMMLAGCGDKNKTNNSVTSSATEEPDGDTTEVPADPAKITNHFFKLLLTFFSQQLGTHPVCFSQCKILIHLAPP